MNPGRYRHRIDFEAPVQTRGERGEVINTWGVAISGDGKHLAGVPAEVLTGPGRELMAAASKFAETTARIRTWWFPDLKPTWRIVWDGKVFDITGIETDSTGRFEYFIRCKDGLTDGA